MRAFFAYGVAGGAVMALAAGCGATVTVTEDGDGGSGGGGSGGCVVGDRTYSVGETFFDGCNECTCEEGGTVGCTKRECTGTCTYNGQTYDAGESFDAGDGCNTCTCDIGGTVSCTNISCGGCDDIPPECPQPGTPNCESWPECGPQGWECVLFCDDCSDEPPPPCPPPPEGCFWDGPYCIDGSWTCGDLVCEKGCNQDPPLCEQPPGCWAEQFCNGFEWECVLHCDEETCESLYPEGQEQVYQLILDECSCSPMRPCAQSCQGYCSSGMVSNSCQACIDWQVDNTTSCVVNAALGQECQSSDECNAYVDCVVEGGP